MKNSAITSIKTKFTTMKLSGTALLWVGLATLVYVPTSEGGTLTVIVAGMGFLSFAAGFLMFADALKGELVEQLRENLSSRQ